MPTWIWMRLAALCALILAIVALVPKWQARAAKDHEKTVELENALRRTLVQILGGLVVAVGACVAWYEFSAPTKPIEAVQPASNGPMESPHSEKVTDTFIRAIDHIGRSGSNTLAVRLGGIFALEQIAAESPEYHWPIVEVLTAYVRENARVAEEESTPTAADNQPAEKEQSENSADTQEDEEEAGPPADVQAILTVLGRRNTSAEAVRTLDLSETDLNGLHLTAGHFEYANLGGTVLTDARVEHAHFEHAHLDGVNFDGADLEDAHLEGADLTGARLEDADLRGTHFEGASLSDTDMAGATLQGTHLEGTPLSKMSGLTQEQLDAACVDDKTDVTGTALKRPERRPCCSAPGGCP